MTIPDSIETPRQRRTSPAPGQQPPQGDRPDPGTDTPPGRPSTPNGNGGACAAVPDLVRLRYFYGQLLGAEDFQAEQRYFREKLKLHNRCLHGYGVVCGLEVEIVPVEEDCIPPTPEERDRLEDERDRLRPEIERAQLAGTPARAARERLAAVQRQLDCLPTTEPRRPVPSELRIRCGLAYDCDGNELIVRQPLKVDLQAGLTRGNGHVDTPPRAREPRPSNGHEHPPMAASPIAAPSSGDVTVPTEPAPRAGSVYVSLCYCEQPIRPVRPVLAEACGAAPDCTNGRIRETVRVRVSTEPPPEDDRCEPCCEPCCDEGHGDYQSECIERCVLLARIDEFRAGQALRPSQVHNEVRRFIAPYALTRVSGVSWTHGASYTRHETAQVLGAEGDAGGLVFHFSRPVLTSTITRGVIDVWVIEGGRGRHAGIYNLDITDPIVQAGRTTRWLRVRQTSRETLQDGDRVLIQLRASFILDRCCSAVDGENVGGRVPLASEFERYRKPVPKPECLTPYSRFGPWVSGNAVQAGTFESWFLVREPGGKEEQ
jgi:hypothetical protein